MKTLSFGISFVMFSANLLSQGTSIGSAHLLLPFHARPAALAQAVVSHPESFSSMFINPALTGNASRTELFLSHMEWIQDTRMETIGGSIPFEFGTLSVALTSSSIEGIQLREKPGPPDGSFAARFSTFQASFARSVVEQLSVGAGIKYIHEKIFVDEAIGYAVDLGLLYETPIQGLRSGLSVINLGEMSAFRHSQADMPSMVQGGVSYKYGTDNFDVVTSLDFRSIPRQQQVSFLAGIEGRYQGFASLRIGHQSGSESRSLSAGIGLSYEFFTLDYAYVPFSLRLGDGHVLSLTFSL
jgi:hypothetical protein